MHAPSNKVTPVIIHMEKYERLNRTTIFLISHICPLSNINKKLQQAKIKVSVELTLKIKKEYQG